MRRVLAVVLVVLVSPLAAAGPAGPADQSDQAEGVFSVEIVITADKRETPLEKVPFAVSVLGAEDLEQLPLARTADLAAHTPNLEIKSAFGASNPTIFLRGVGNNDVNPNATGSVGLYADEVYLSSPSAQVLQLFDLERIEVLRGPQGTLYGKNTTGGAVNLVSRKPGGRREGYARLSYGRFDELGLEGALELPFGEANGVRLAFVTDNRDGITRNRLGGEPVNDIGASSGRAQVQIIARPDLRLLLNLHGAVNRADALQFKSRGLIDGADVLGYADTKDPYAGAYNRRGPEEIDAWGSSLHLTWEQPAFVLTSISALERNRRLVLEDSDASPNQLVEIDWSNRSHAFSQELRLASIARRPFGWMAGVYLFHERLDVHNSFDVLRELRAGGAGFNPEGGPFVLDQVYDQTTTSIAPFASVELRLAERSTLTAGLRFTVESRDFDLDTFFHEPEFIVPLIDGLRRDLTEKNLSGDVRLTHQLADAVVLYGGLSRGYKSGGFNGGAFFFPEEAEAVDPEFLTSLEAGARTTCAGGRIRLHASGFYYFYEDLQVFNIANPGGFPIQVLDNAADARVKGLELELSTRSFAGLSLGVNAGLLDARYRRYLRDDGVDFSGNRLVGAPKWTFGARLLAERPVSGLGELLASADFSYRDRTFFNSSNTPRVSSAGYGLLNGRAGLRTGQGRYELALWGRNLTDHAAVVDVLPLDDLGFDTVVIGPPRTFGVEVVYRYGAGE